MISSNMEWKVEGSFNHCCLVNFQRCRIINTCLYAVILVQFFGGGVCNKLSEEYPHKTLHGSETVPQLHSSAEMINTDQVRELVDSFKRGNVKSLKYSHLGNVLEDAGLSVDGLEKVSRKVHFPGSSACKTSHSRTKRSPSLDIDIEEGQAGSDYPDSDEVAFSWGEAVLGGLFAVHRSDTETGEPCQTLYNVAALWVESMIYAVKKINSNSGVLPNTRLGYEVRDDCSDSNKVLQAGLQFVDAMSANGSCDGSTRTVGVVGTGSSRTSDIVAKLLALFDLPQVSYSASSPIFSNKVDYPYFLRTVGSDSDQAKVLADLAETYRWNYVALIYSDDQYGSPGQVALTELFGEIGVCAVVTRKVSQEMTADEVDSIVEEIESELRIQVIFTFTSKSEIQRVLAAAQRGGLTGRTWVATDSWGHSQDITSGFEDVVTGMLGVSPRVTIDDDFKKYLYEIDPSTYTDNPWYRASLEAYGCVFNDSGSTNCPHSDPFLESLDSPSEGRATSLVIDAVYALAYGLHDMLMECQEEDCFDQFSGADYLEYVKNVTFHGLTSNPFAFDENGDPHSEYSIFNLQNDSGEMTFEEIGSWKFESHLNLSRPVVWSGGGAPPVSRCSEDCLPGTYLIGVEGQVSCCWQCVPCPVNHISSSINSEVCRRCDVSEYTSANHTECIPRTQAVQGWGSPINIIILVCALLGLIATSVCFITYLIFRNTPVIKATSMELSLVCLVGFAFIFTSAPLYAAEPTDMTCQTQTLIVSVGFSILIAALLIKTNRISQIFNRKLSDGRPSMLLQIKYQILFVITLVLAQFSLSMIYLQMYPSKAVNSYDIPEMIFLECQIQNQWFAVIVTIGYSLILGMICNYQAFRIRKLPGQFNDSRSIFFTIVVLIIVCFVIAVVTLSTYGDSKALGMSLSVLFSGYSSLCLLFGPKMWVVLFRPENNVPQSTFETFFRRTPSSLSPVSAQDTTETEINGNTLDLTKPGKGDRVSEEEDDIFDSGNYSDVSTVVGDDDEDVEEFLKEVAKLEEEIQSANKQRHASIQELEELKDNMKHLEETHGKDLERMKELCRQEKQSVIEILAEAGLSEEEIQAKMSEVAAQKSRSNSSTDKSDQSPQERVKSFEEEWRKLNVSSENCLTDCQKLKDKMFPNGFDDLRQNGVNLSHQNGAFEHDPNEEGVSSNHR